MLKTMLQNAKSAKITDVRPQYFIYIIYVIFINFLNLLFFMTNYSMHVYWFNLFKISLD